MDMATKKKPLRGELAPKGNALVPLEQACRLLAEVRTVPEARQLRDQAEVFRHYLSQQQGGFTAMQDAAEIKVRAERRLGELLRETVNHEGSKGVGRTMRPTLPEGVSKSDSSRWQQMARLPADEFERYLAQMREDLQPLTTAGALRLVQRVGRSARSSPRRAEAIPFAPGQGSSPEVLDGRAAWSVEAADRLTASI
jgi:hypothetical protein